MPNVAVLFALVCTLSVQRLAVAIENMESPGGSFVRVTELGNDQRRTVALWGEILAVETALSRPGPNEIYIRVMLKSPDRLTLQFYGRGNLVYCEIIEGRAEDVASSRRFYYNGTSGTEDESELLQFLNNHPDIDKSLFDWEASRRSCMEFRAAERREQHRLMKQRIVAYEARQQTAAAAAADETRVQARSRRAISLMWPGTTWCGVGNVSRGNAEVEGVHVETDKCCRQHDLCNYTIGGFTSKYNMFNFRFHTISHCECDDRFRTCLRMASSPHSDTVGRLFFNILGMKCFVFQRESACVERNWWGGCIRQGYQHSALLRESVPYYEE